MRCVSFVSACVLTYNSTSQIAGAGAIYTIKKSQCQILQQAKAKYYKSGKPYSSRVNRFYKCAFCYCAYHTQVQQTYIFSCKVNHNADITVLGVNYIPFYFTKYIFTISHNIFNMSKCYRF